MQVFFNIARTVRDDQKGFIVPGSQFVAHGILKAEPHRDYEPIQRSGFDQSRVPDIGCGPFRRQSLGHFGCADLLVLNVLQRNYSSVGPAHPPHGGYGLNAITADSSHRPLKGRGEDGHMKGLRWSPALLRNPMDASSHRHRRQTPNLCELTPRDDGERDGIGSRMPGRRRRIRHAHGRSINDGAGELAHQDHLLRQRQARVPRNRAESGGPGSVPRWPLEFPPSVARSNSPRRGDRSVRIVTRKRCPLQDGWQLL